MFGFMNIKSFVRGFVVAIVFVAIVLNSNKLFAQLQITQGTALPAGWTIDSLVQNVLVGEGVEVSNVRFNNSAGAVTCNAIGKFQTGGNPTNLGISSGIIIGSGAVTFAAGPNNTGGGNASSGCSNQTFAPLSNATTGTTNDCSVLEFDFVPRSDSIRFRYVFASEEYPEFVCSNFNDVFGFFISGIRPSGGMYNNTNIALVPNTTTPITINNVNGGVSAGSATPCILTNSQYYVDNTGGATVQYDGFTTVLTAEASVIPCQTYHLVMAIADVGDNAYDSGVFLEANSLTSNAISFDFVNAANPDAASDLYEGCVATINMSRPQRRSVGTQISIEFEGTATNGVDFAIINPTIFFPPDTESFSIAISPYMDGTDEGMETAKFVLSAVGGCLRSDSVEFHILDTEEIRNSISRDTITSASNSVTLTANVTGGMPNRTITWRNLSNPSAQERTGTSIVVPVTPDAQWLSYVQDFCGNFASDTMLIGVRRFFAYLLRAEYGTAPFASLVLTDTIICDQEPLDLWVHGADSCAWYISGQNQPFALRDSTVRVTPSEMTTYVVHSYKWWNNQYWEDVDSVRVLVVPLPEVAVSASSQRICEGQSVTINASGTNNYSWDVGETFGSASSKTFVPDSTTMFVVYGLTNGAACYGRDSVLVVVDTIPDIYLGDGTGVCGGEEAELTVTTTAESFRWSANPSDPSLVGQETNSHLYINPPSTTVYTLTAVNGVCTNTATVTVAVEPMPIAIGVVTPKTVSLGQMEAVFSDQSQNATTRKWELPFGEVSTDREVTYIVPDDVDSITVRLWAYNPYQCFDTTTVTVYVDHTTLWIPNAFTPEESTNNTFLVKMNDVQRYHIFIYDRRGQLVFESYDSEKPWDGRSQNGEKCPQGAYTYLISCHKITYPFDQIVRKGTVLLIR